MPRILLLAFIGLCFNFQALAQCCAAGNPSSGGDDLGMAKNSFSVSANFIHSYSDTYYSGNTAVDSNYWNYTKFDFTLLSLKYGLSDKVQLSTELGYFFDKSNQRMANLYNLESQEFNDTLVSNHAQGFGDFAFGLQHLLYSNKKKLIQISHIEKITLPVGEFDQMNKNIILPIDIQPSSGSIKYKTAILLTKGFFGSKFSLNSYLSSEFSREINTDRTVHKYGNLYNASLNISHKTSTTLSTHLTLNYLKREKATNNKEIIEASGGNYFSIQPKINYILKDRFALSTTVNIPVYNFANVYQLTNKYFLNIGISSSLGNKKDKTINTKNWGLNMNELQFFVDGICGMCKDRIEDLAYQVKGVQWAEWDLDNKTLSLKFKEDLNKEKLAKTLARGGHDNWMLKANEKAYNNLHSCCKYRSGH